MTYLVRAMVVTLFVLTNTFSWGVVFAASDRHALLIAVGEYPLLDRKWKLRGPANDAVAMRQLLVETLGFAESHLTTLCDNPDMFSESNLPTKTNMEEGFERLASSAEKGDRVVIFMAGHGSQQPAKSGDDVENDGLDEIFLPHDAGTWQKDSATVLNAVTDDEIAQWLKAIQTKGAHVWVIFDCCHAGDLARSADMQIRYVPPEGLGVPKEATDEAKSSVRKRKGSSVIKTRGFEPKSVPLDLLNTENLSVLYACQSHEKALEISVGTGSEEGHFGLLTYSLISALTENVQPMTYRELSRQIYRKYVATGRQSVPTPLAEGADVDSIVLGDEAARRLEIRVSEIAGRKALSQLEIDAGLLHNITDGSVLAVYSPTDDTDFSRRRKVAGYIRVEDVGVDRSRVVPCAYRDSPTTPPKALLGGLCEVVESDYGDLRLSVSVSRTSFKGESLPEGQCDALVKILNEISLEKDSPISVAIEQSKSRWLVQMDGDNFTLTRSKVASPFIQDVDTIGLGSFKSNSVLKEVLRMQLARISRAENLIRLASTYRCDAGSESTSFGSTFRIHAEVQSHGGRGAAGMPAIVRPGDVLNMRIENTGKREIDLTVLYVDSHMGITAVYPTQNQVNRIRLHQSAHLHPIRIKDGPFGRGHFIFIAVASAGPPVDFSWISQIDRPKERSQSTPLESLMESAAFGGRSRSARAGGDSTLDILPVDIQRPEQSE